MPLRQTTYGGVCPLDKFNIDIAAGAGCYNNDPVETCINCNFADISIIDFDLEKICQSPSDMDWDEYDRLRKTYTSTTSTEEKRTKKSFWDFVKENYRKPTNLD